MKIEMSGLLACACLTVALIVSGCICCDLSSLTGSTTPTPTAMPSVIPTEAPWSNYTATNQSYHPLPTVAPGTVVTVTPAPTPVVPVNLSAEFIEGGSDKDSYNKGDNATCYVIIKNTGNAEIDRINFNIDVYKQIFGYVKVLSSSPSSDDQNIAPGETKRVEFSVTIPSDYKGYSTSGNYRFDVAVLVGGKNIGSFSKEVSVI